MSTEMNLDEAITYLRPIAESATVGHYAEALGLVLAAAGVTQPEPTDEEREVLVRILSTKRIHTNESLGAQRADANAILEAGFRRPAQAEPTDAQVERAARSIAEWNTSDVPLELCRAVARAALKSAFTAGQEEQS